MRTTLKRLFEAALVGAGTATLGRRVKRGQALILAFHNVVPDGATPVGDTSLHLSLDRFRAFLDHLAACCDVVPLPQLLDGSGISSRSHPTISITFDDAYRGAVTLAVPELVERGLPATIFVVPSLLDDHVFWWDALGDADSGRVGEDLRERALDELRGEDSKVRAWAESTGFELNSVPSLWRTASKEELRQANAQPGIALGSHTWSHPNLARLEPAEIREELEKSLQWLRSEFHDAIPWLSYPYGSYSDDVMRVAAEVGYDAATLISGGWTRAPVRSPTAVPRLNIPSGLSTHGFSLRTAGL